MITDSFLGYSTTRITVLARIILVGSDFGVADVA